MKKKLTSTIAAALVITGLAACGRAAADEAATTEDARTGATVTDDANLFAENFGAQGHWIGAATTNLSLDNDFIVEGDFWDKDDEANDYKRKLALYTQDDDHNVLERFSLTVPSLIVRSPNTVIAKGTIVGDVYVEANGFNLDDATIEGNIVFASEEYQESANLEDGHVTGTVTVE